MILRSVDDNVQDAGSSMKGLVAFAEEHVPLEDRNSTVLALSATAGLRMISEEAKNAILDSCFSWLLKNSPFIIRRDLISVISGKEGPNFVCGYIRVRILMHCAMDAAEGAYGWLSINFLHGTALLGALPPPQESNHTPPHRQAG
jgi:Golgi nucleoside diphosphatase